MPVRPASRRVTGRPAPRAIRASVAGSMAAKAVEMGTLVLLATVVPRVLGPHDYGRFAVPLTIVTLGSLALTLGGPTVMARFVPAVPPPDRTAVALALGARLARGRAVQLAVIVAATTSAGLALPGHLRPLDVVVVLVALSLNVAATLALQVGLGLGCTGGWSSRYPLQNSVLVFAAVGLHAVAGVQGAMVAIVVAAVAGAALGWATLRPLLAAPTRSVAIPEGALRFGVLQAGGAALVQFAQRGGVLAVALLAGSAAETGYAALAIGIALGATYAVLQAFTVSLPHLAGGEAGGGPASHEQSEAVLRRLAGALLAVIVPAGAVAALLLDRVVPLAFGEEYAGAVSAFGPALALVSLAPLHALAVQSAALRLRADVALVSGGASAVAFVAAALVAVPQAGAAGGTLAALVGALAGGVAWIVLLPGAVGTRVAVASFGGAGLLLALTALA